MPISSSHLELFSGFKGKIDTLDDSVRFGLLPLGLSEFRKLLYLF